MADDVLKSLWVAIGFRADEAQKAAATKSVAEYEQAVVRAEKAIEDARWAGAKTEEEIARLTRETNLRLAKEALEKAKREEREREEADKKQAAALKTARARIGDFVRVAVGMGAAIQAAALGVHAGVVKMAQGFDALNFTSQRTGVTVRNIQAIGYAASQMGSTVEAGVGSLENFARTLRQSPGSYSLLERLGIKTTDAKGARRSADALFQEFGKALRDKPGYLQDAYLQDFGIDEKTGRALIQGLDQFTAEYNEKLRKTGLDPDKAAKDGAALQRTFGSLAASISIIGQKVASNLFDGENNAFQRFIDFLDKHGDQIAAVISHIAQVVLELAKALLELVTSPEAKKWFDQLMLAFGDFDKETGKFTANTEKMKVALGLLGTYVATSWIKKILDTFGLLGGGWKSLLVTLGLASPAGLGAATVAAGVGVGAVAANQLPKVLERDGPGAIDPATGGVVEGNGFSGIGTIIGRGYRAVRRALGGGGAAASTNGSSAIGGSSPRLPGNVGIGKWWTNERQQHAIDTLKAGGVSELGARALVARWSAVEAAGGPASVNPKSGAFGIAQWLTRDRLAPIKGNTDFDAQLAHALKELSTTERKSLRQLNAATTPYEAAVGASMYERAEGYNAKTGVDDFTAKTAAAMGRLVGAASKAPAQAPTAADGGTFPNGAPRITKPASMANDPTVPGIVMNRGVPANAPAPAPRPISVKDLFPNGLPKIAPSSLPSFAVPAAPSSSSADYSRTMNVTVKQGDLNVHGHQEARQIGEVYKTISGYRNSDLIRNLRSSLA